MAPNDLFVAVLGSCFGEVVMVRKQDDPSRSDNPDPLDLVPVIFAANTQEVEFYQTLLADADIPTFIDTDADGLSARTDKGIAILVSAEVLDEASDIITAREELDAHILAHPEEHEFDDEDDDELTGSSLDDDTVQDEDIFFHKDPFGDDDDHF